MDAEELTGYYTYRSYLNRPEPVDDFNRLRFAEAELFLFVQRDGTVAGTLAFPAAPGMDEKTIMDVSGRVSAWSPVQLSFTGKGRPNTDIVDFHYEYDGSIIRHWEIGINSVSLWPERCCAPRTTQSAPTCQGRRHRQFHCG